MRLDTSAGVLQLVPAQLSTPLSAEQERTVLAILQGQIQEVHAAPTGRGNHALAFKSATSARGRCRCSWTRRAGPCA